MDLSIHIDLTVTPDAAMECYDFNFNWRRPKASGSGDLKMDINSKGNSICWLSNIESGTLASHNECIEKTFMLEKGGTISLMATQQMLILMLLQSIKQRHHFLPFLARNI